MADGKVCTSQVAIQCRDSVTRGTAEEQPLSAISALCPAPGQVEKKLPAVIHDERGNTVYEEPCVAWLHLRIVQARGVRNPGSRNIAFMPQSSVHA